ncbi:transposase [Gluconobacter cerinus]|uniref:transposase n=2 Tax=Gluconobacter TaxID=441 RepID=UPI0039EA4224
MPFGMDGPLYSGRSFWKSPGFLALKSRRTLTVKVAKTRLSGIGFFDGFDALPHAPRYVVCDRGYASNQFREALWERGSRPVIPTKRNEPQVACPKWAYRHRHLVENLWARLKEWRAVGTR